MGRLLMLAMLCVGALLAGATVDVGVPAAVAKTKKNENRVVLRFPSDELPDENALAAALQSSDVPTTIIIEKGVYPLQGQLFVFNRSNVIVCGATGRAGDVVIESAGGGLGNGARSAVFMQQASNITFRDMTIRGTNDVGTAVFMDASLIDTTLSSFCDTITLDGCRLEGAIPVQATAAVRALTMKDCRVHVNLTDGIGMIWGDGDALLVTKTKFTVESGVEAFAAILVLGASANLSEGQRAQRVILTRNRIEGRFGRGMDLSDVVDVRIRKNKVIFSGDPIRPATDISGGLEIGRTGILIRRNAATALPEDFELRKNKVRGAFYGVRLDFTGRGVVAKNDLRGSGSRDVDQEFGENGGAVRVQLIGAICRVDISKNDMRNLNSPKTAFDGEDIVDVPAVVVDPSFLSDLCFEDGRQGNKTSKGRLLFSGEGQ